MIFDWFNAREAVEVGTSLADYLLPRSAPASIGNRTARRSVGTIPNTQEFLQHAARETRSLKLNLFKRANLLGSFKRRLVKRGYDRKAAEELAQMLLLEISGAGAGVAATVANAQNGSADPESLRRVPALLGEADALFAHADYARAVDRFNEALAIDSRHAVAHAKRGAALCRLGRYHEGEEAFRRAIKVRPTCPGVHYSLGTLLRAKGDFSGSETALRRAVKQDPRDPEALVGLGLTLGAYGRLSDAKSCFEKALRLKPHHPSALCALGWAATLEGRFDEAEKLFRGTLEVDPYRPAAWAWLAGLRRMTAADKDWLEGVERTLSRGVAPLEEAKLRFAMGKYFDDIGRFPQAFEQYKRANEQYKLVALPYDRTARTKFVDDIIRVYTRQRLTQPAEGASDSERPLFVVGMMRSGTSLVEQIISSHPRAAGAGELDFWGVATQKHKESLRSQGPDAQLARKLADSYLKELSRYSAHALRVADKSPFNSDRLGLIHMIFPRARFIYLQRDPVDTCLSCYFQDFANAMSYTFDLSDLAHYYCEHHRLLGHWRSALPEGALLEVPYEELVADQEAWSRRIIEFIGLEWNPRCLEFHKTERPVLTASNWQVRQRIYSSSVGRWKNYAKHITPLLKLRHLQP